jgi:flagellar biosynthesis/type III secretory pathway chaperone
MKLDKERLLKKLKECGRNSDTEVAHIEADRALVEYINNDEITELWNEISSCFWYA